MRIGVASGKGGTGKTLLATSLAYILAEARPVQYVDCDVEEPNGRIFLKPRITRSEDVRVDVPVIDGEACALCGECAEFCRFGALAAMGEKVLLFPELCHSCGGCALVCPNDAIRMGRRSIGKVEVGRSGKVGFVEGRLNVGEPMAAPVIYATLEAADEESLVIVDAPPGTSCALIAAIRACDYVLLVTEPTPFGLHDLRLTLEVVAALGLRAGVVVNREGLGDLEVEPLCAEAGVPILARIPFDRRIAEVYATGDSVTDALPDVRSILSDLACAVLQESSCRNS